MAVTSRAYSLPGGDFARVRAFLEQNMGDYGEGCRYPEFWEYAHSHTFYDYHSHWKNRIWEENGSIVAVVWYEMKPDKAYLTCADGYGGLLDEMLAYAEKHFAVEGKLNVEISSMQQERAEWLVCKGYHIAWKDEILLYELARNVPQPEATCGYTIIRAEELKEEDWKRFISMTCQSFGGVGEGDVNAVGLGNAASGYDKHLSRITVAPNGDFAAYAGVWYNEKNRYAYLEPLCTHPDHRWQGLAKAMLYEIMHEIKGRGARFITGGDVPFYWAIGYEKKFEYVTYEKQL